MADYVSLIRPTHFDARGPTMIEINGMAHVILTVSTGAL
jgi:hypothetical protein